MRWSAVVAVGSWVVMGCGDDVGAGDGTTDSTDAGTTAGTTQGPTTAPTTSSTDGGTSSSTDPVTTGSDTTAPTSESTESTTDPTTGTAGSASSESGSGTTSASECAIECGSDELCDISHAGTDDDCDGTVDEDCPCVPGLQQACFAGDPSYLGTSGCAPGVQSCVDGSWGSCVGGAHAIDGCFDFDPTACHGLDTRPMVPVSLLDGLGNFGDDAISHTWTATCPPGDTPCPQPVGDDFAPLLAGEHVVTYAKTTAAGDDSCDVIVRASKPGLHVTLEWEHPVGNTGLDLDLHLHEPGVVSPWAFEGGAQDCGWANCTAVSAELGTIVDWFAGNVPPDPVSWSLSGDDADNDCWFAPRGEGMVWESLGLGCHNPRLLTDNITCDALDPDPESFDFCHAERIDLDVMPLDTWHRLAVHYYSDHGLDVDALPRVRIWCEGAPVADLGPAGFYDPEAPVTLAPTGGINSAVWLVADVAVTLDECDVPRCVVAPLYEDELARTPYIATTSAAESSFGPAYPAAP